nr:MAG TPA: hypothetical protein [Caudoviricetes sp.]
MSRGSSPRNPRARDLEKVEEENKKKSLQNLLTPSTQCAIIDNVKGDRFEKDHL